MKIQILKELTGASKIETLNINKTMLIPLLLSLGVITGSCASKSNKVPAAKASDSDATTEARTRELQDEISIGREVAAKLFGTYGDLNQEKNQIEYLNLILQTLSEKTGRPEIIYRVGILDTDEINAFAAPGGYILVTKGLLKNVQNEQELAGVLAHEMGHINHRHLFKEVAPKREVSAGETLSRFLSRGGSNVSFAFSQAVSKGMKTLLDEGLKPELEYEADQSGVEYSWAAGYDPRYFREFIARLAKTQKSLSKTLLKTHPSFENRLNSLDINLNSLGMSEPLTPLANTTMIKRFAVLTEK